MENQRLPKMSLSILHQALSRAEMKNVIGGDDEQFQIDPGSDTCKSRWTQCSAIAEDTWCCGSGKCMTYNGIEQCV